ncbi:MAG: hypothetical protein JO048_01135 [Methylobacteriaceae bacterium]|nr:hypothetical protein [Methylobacteriaceae bacterium]MBV9289354.1 hypothetical protein [Hyphomicrobiales bacterium]
MAWTDLVFLGFRLEFLGMAWNDLEFFGVPLSELSDYSMRYAARARFSPFGVFRAIKDRTGMVGACASLKVATRRLGPGSGKGQAALSIAVPRTYLEHNSQRLSKKWSRPDPALLALQRA